MTLPNKIYYCRKKAGLSQEELAEKLEVSRQAISKWECGEAIPETTKLLSLAKILGVTVDWLLSEEEPPKEEVKNTAEKTASEEPEASASSKEVPRRFRHAYREEEIPDKLPAFLRQMAMRWGWLAGVYVALVGAGITGIGSIAKLFSAYMVRTATSVTSSFTDSFGWYGSDVQILDEYGNPVSEEIAADILSSLGGSLSAADPFSGFMGSANTMLAHNPVDIIANVILILGIVILLCGILLAVFLRKWGRAKR